jgi:hypothetical protein
MRPWSLFLLQAVLLRCGGFLIFFGSYTNGRTPWTSDRPAARPLPKHRTTQTPNERARARTHTHTHTPNIHAVSGIRTHDHGLRASEGSSCPTPLGYRDRPLQDYVYKCMFSYFDLRFSFENKSELYINILNQTRLVCYTPISVLYQI